MVLWEQMLHLMYSKCRHRCLEISALKACIHSYVHLLAPCHFAHHSHPIISFDLMKAENTQMEDGLYF